MSDNKFFNAIFGVLTNLGILFLIFMVGYIGWLEYKRKAQGDLSLILSSDTRWVKSKQPIYFIMGNILGKINADGSDLDFFYKNDSPLKEFVFSPNGRYILLTSDNELLLYDRQEESLEVIDSLGPLVEEGQAQGVFKTPQWSPNSEKICYEVYRWSDIGASDYFYVYDMTQNKKQLVRGPLTGIQEFFWDTKGENLYFYRSNSLPDINPKKPYMVKIYRVSELDKSPELVRTVGAKNISLKPEEIISFGINGYFDNNRNVSTRLGQKEMSFITPHGKKLGIDPQLYLYYENPQGKQLRLFNVKDTAASVVHVRWLPDERYVVMTHPSLGLLIMDPATIRVGKLVSAGAFGWYETLQIVAEK